MANDQVGIGVERPRAPVAVIEVGHPAGDDDEAAVIQDGEALISGPAGVHLVEEGALGDEAQAFPIEPLQGGVQEGQDLLFFGQGDPLEAEEIAAGELLGADRGARRRGRAKADGGG